MRSPLYWQGGLHVLEQWSQMGSVHGAAASPDQTLSLFSIFTILSPFQPQTFFWWAFQRTPCPHILVTGLFNAIRHIPSTGLLTKPILAFFYPSGKERSVTIQ